MLMKKILLATDFSPPAQELMACLAELKAHGMEEVILFHAVSIVRAQGSALEVQRHYEERLQQEKKRLEAEGYQVSIRVPMGFPPEEIINTAVEEGASLILMGSHGGGMIRSLFLGSTTFDVVRLSPVPVLVEKFRDVNRKDYTPVCRLKFNRILFPTDFSPCARQVWQELLNMAPYIDSAVLVSVVQKVRDEAMWQELRDRNEQELQQMRKELEAAGCEVAVHLTDGTPSRRILEIADEEAVSLILMPRRGEGFIQQLLLGSTAEAVARQSKQPVLLVPCDTHVMNGSGVR
ncbi:universal stress protein [Anoxynatronum buryatiense]|uniref:Nucleotide-binding universal stress protein, UspA family n=1 Tax=Anoxynatronum buryatiense TaxID=489973 RepID=A0AA45WXK7_9CLOT|nr:universal stress protein [Anoxynatronum buryatiense]SMP65101.1 Nucleotide-binding universal stress protein, UspA family [Anoxynatronum buryatiense]